MFEYLLKSLAQVGPGALKADGTGEVFTRLHSTSRHQLVRLRYDISSFHQILRNG